MDDRSLASQKLGVVIFNKNLYMDTRCRFYKQKAWLQSFAGVSLNNILFGWFLRFSVLYLVTTYKEPAKNLRWSNYFLKYPNDSYQKIAVPI